MPSGINLALIVIQSFLVSAGATWLVREIARRRGWLAPPRPDRWHRRPTALYGGVGIFATFVLGLLLLLPGSSWTFALVGLTTLMFLAGLADDTWDIRPQTKVVVQLAGGLLLYAAGFHFNEAIRWWLDLAVVVFWVVAITNAMNLLDNMNGLAAGTAIIAGTTRLLLFNQTGNAEGAIASAVFIGACAGFLVFNFPTASIFMGDSGSFTIGFALAALNLSTSSEAFTKTTFSILVFPVLVLALPIFDTALVSAARYFSGRAISQGGRDHASHRLVAIGLSETSAVLILWTISAAAGAIALILYNVGFSYALFFAAIILLGLVLFGVVLSRVHVYEEGAEPDTPASAWGFALPGELLYKRQILWVLVDAVTTVLALNFVLEATERFLPRELWMSPADASGLALSVAMVLAGLMASGLYRWDWAHFGAKVAARVIVGVGLGILAVLIIQRAGLINGRWHGVFLAQAWLVMSVGVCGTRLFVRAVDRWLRVMGERANG